MQNSFKKIDETMLIAQSINMATLHLVAMVAMPVVLVKYQSGVNSPKHAKTLEINHTFS